MYNLLDGSLLTVGGDREGVRGPTRRKDARDPRLDEVVLLVAVREKEVDQAVRVDVEEVDVGVLMGPHADADALATSVDRVAVAARVLVHPHVDPQPRLDRIDDDALRADLGGARSGGAEQQAQAQQDPWVRVVHGPDCRQPS